MRKYDFIIPEGKGMKRIQYKTEADVLLALETAAEECRIGKLDTRTAQVIISASHVALEALRQQHKQEAEKDDSEEFMVFK